MDQPTTLEDSGVATKRIKLEIAASNNDDLGADLFTTKKEKDRRSRHQRNHDKKMKKHHAAIVRAVDRINDQQFGTAVGSFLQGCLDKDIWPGHIHTFPATPAQCRPFPEDLHPSLQQVCN